MTTGGDLFAAAASERLAARAPLAERLRPRSLDDIVGQAHLIGPGGPLRILLERDSLRSSILWGPAGTGKTTLARLLATSSEKAFVPLSATSAGVRDVRAAIDEAMARLGEYGQGTVVFIDEVHRFSKSQQDVLLPSVEDGTIVLIGATTENPYFEVNAPLLSRATLWRLHPLDDADLSLLIERAGIAEGVSVSEEAASMLIAVADGDARSMLTTFETAAALAHTGMGSEASVPEVTTTHVSLACSGIVYHQGRDEHYDQVSALIKSIRGSDADAGLYWLVRMLEAGEDPVFLARRLVILASEDIGMADPLSLLTAEAAARAVQLVGLPEARLTLAHAVIHLALAPKSNRVTVALGRASSDVAASGGAVPAHLRDAHYRGAADLGFGVEYRYPHDDPSGFVDQAYRPESVQDHVYYEPSDHGREATAAAWLNARRHLSDDDKS